MQKNGFENIESNTDNTPVLRFLQLKKNSRRVVSFTGEEAENMIQGSVNRIRELFAKYSVPGVEYEYINQEDPKSYYTDCDDFARHEN